MELLAFGDTGWGDELFRATLMTIAVSITAMIIGFSFAAIFTPLKLSKFKNIFLKFSGYNYVLGEGRRWDFPYNDALWVYKEAYQKFGSNMVWGSDFPVVKFSSTYKQAFEVFNKYCDFMSENDKNLIQGNNLLKLIKERGKID